MWESIVGFFFYWIMKDYLNNVYFYIIIYLKYVLYYKSYMYIDWLGVLKNDYYLNLFIYLLYIWVFKLYMCWDSLCVIILNWNL